MNKFIFITLFLVENVFSVCLAQSYPYQKESIPVPQRVKDLLSRMTLEEKIAELNLIPYYTKDDSICRSLIRAGKVGAFLKANGAELNRSLQEEALKHSRLGIPLIFHEDVIHGYRTITPIPLAESCSWNPELVEQSAAMAAREAAAAGIQLTYAPMVDISYDPRWGRIMETSGEDAYLCGELAAARVRGFQGNDLTSPHTIAACVKHFAGYGAVMAGRDYQETDVSLRKLQEIYLPPFQAAINAGVASVMCAYTSYDGEPLTMNYFMNEEMLRKQMQFKGLLMTDWTTFQHAVTEGAADNGQEAAERGIKSGIDMDMSAKQFIEFLPELVRTQKVPEQLINRAAARALELKFRLGLFDNPFAYFNTEREKQRPDRFLKLSHDFAEGSSLFTRRLVATLFGNNSNNNHHRYCHENAGHIACHKHFSYGYAGNQRINNQVNSGRNNRRTCGGRSCYRSTEGSAVTALFHFRNKHFTLHSSVSVSTAGNAAHQQTEQYVNLSQTAGHMTHEHVGKFHQLIADTGIVHDGSCHNKEGNCQQREGLRAGNNTLEYQMRRRSRIQKGKVGNRCTEQGISDWNTGKIKHKNNDDGQISHYFSSFPEPVTSCQTNLIEYTVMSTNAISTEELI